MLRDFFPNTNIGASLYGGFLINDGCFCRIFPMGDSIENMLIPVNAFLVENGYESILPEQINQDVYTYENKPVSLGPHAYQEEFVLTINREIFTSTQTQFLIHELLKFRDERNWEQFHNPKDLALAISVEANELLELFLWKAAEQADKEKVKEELADVFAFALLMAEKYGFNVEEIVLDKIKKNGDKYPIEKAKGTAKKYNEL